MSLAAHMYVDENQGDFPPRVNTNRWPNRFYDSYGKSVRLLLCPTDIALPTPPASSGDSPSNNVADAAPRSYLINGWNDYFADQFGTTDWGTIEKGMAALPSSIKENAIIHTSDTILLGEKKHDRGDFFMDLLEAGGNDFNGIMEQGQHSNSGKTSDQKDGSGSSGGSNYAMADGSARFIKFPQAVAPLHLWAISDYNRDYYHISY